MRNEESESPENVSNIGGGFTIVPVKLLAKIVEAVGEWYNAE